MAVSVADQARALLGAIGLGTAAGLLYDLFRVLRVRIPLRWLGPVLDLLFWLCCTITFFLWSVDSAGGLVRVYTAIAALTGAWGYFALPPPTCCPFITVSLPFLPKLWGSFCSCWRHSADWGKIFLKFAKTTSIIERNGLQ